MDELEIKGRKYISSKRAAKVTGYAKDYVGQLARGGKVEATRVGRAWYVSEEAIIAHAGITASAPDRAGDAVPVVTQNSAVMDGAPSAGTSRLYSLNQLRSKVPAAAPRLLKTWGSITYHADDTPLIPKTITTVAPAKTIRMVKTDTASVSDIREIEDKKEEQGVRIVRVQKTAHTRLTPPPVPVTSSIDGVATHWEAHPRYRKENQTLSAPTVVTEKKPRATVKKVKRNTVNESKKSRLPVNYTLSLAGSAAAFLLVILSGNVVTLEWGINTGQTASAAGALSGPETLIGYFEAIFNSAVDLLKVFFTIVFESFWSFVQDGLNFILNFSN